MTGYNNFASVYDLFMKSINYSSLAKYFSDIINIHITKKNERPILLDLACGSGLLTRELAALGYDVLATDISASMLSVAANSSCKNITYLNQDMRELDLYGTVDYTVCSFDGINHLTSESDVLKTFKKVRLFTNPGGIFVFDVNTLYKHTKILGNNIFVRETDNLYLVWKNYLTSRLGETEIVLDMFALEQNMYKRHQDTFFERAYFLDNMKQMLLSANFAHVHCYRYMKLDEINTEAEIEEEKVVFIGIA